MRCKTLGFFSFLSVIALILLGVYEGGATAHEEVSTPVGQSVELLRLKRRVHRLRLRSTVSENQESTRPKEPAESCYARSESEARERVLASMRAAQEKSLLAEGTTEGAVSESARYPMQMWYVMCEDGISDQEKIAIAAELSSKVEDELVLGSRNPDPDVSQEIIKNILGEKRYIAQVAKCDKAKLAKHLKSVEHNIQYLASHLELSGEQSEQLKALSDTFDQLNEYEYDSASYWDMNRKFGSDRERLLSSVTPEQRQRLIELSSGDALSDLAPFVYNLTAPTELNEPQD